MTAALLERTRAGFIAAYGEEPHGTVFAPGRVNLIGEHVDYNDGLVLPMPLGIGTAIAWSRSDDAAIEAVALDFTERDRFLAATATPPSPPDWRAYVRGMSAGFDQSDGAVGGVRLAIAGSIPRRSGLSSSASLCVAVGRALAATGDGPPRAARELALAAQKAEHEWAGVRCGIMDQMAIAAGEPGQALLLDCQDLSTRPVPLPPEWAVLIVQSGVRRELADGHYNQRRRDCEAAAAALGVASLRRATLQQVEHDIPDPVVRRRARHVVSEIARTAAAVEAIERFDLAGLGTLLRASHASLRDDFEVSIPPVDALVDCLNAAIGPSGGARMTGGGFGGAVVALLERASVERVTAAVRDGYRTPSGEAAEVLTAR